MVNTDLSVENTKRNFYVPPATISETEKRGTSWLVCPNITIDLCFPYSMAWQSHTNKGFLTVMSKILRGALLHKSISWKLLLYTDILSEPWTPGCVIYFNVTRQLCPIRLDNCPWCLGLGSNLWVGDHCSESAGVGDTLEVKDHSSMAARLFSLLNQTLIWWNVQ